MKRSFLFLAILAFVLVSVGPAFAAGSSAAASHLKGKMIYSEGCVLFSSSHLKGIKTSPLIIYVKES